MFNIFGAQKPSYTAEYFLDGQETIKRDDLNKKFKELKMDEKFYKDTTNLELLRNGFVHLAVFGTFMLAMTVLKIAIVTKGFTKAMDSLTYKLSALTAVAPVAFMAVGIIGFAVAEVKRRLHLRQALDLEATKTELDRVVKNMDQHIDSSKKTLETYQKQTTDFIAFRKAFPAAIVTQ